ncbi:MAG: hypothetical protein JW940_34290 [Polyangiaceae bacterium]|nr:hypothetical protein [Polyangiaceae bacterium]
MSLLRDIQDAAVDSSVDLADLLRKCKVLAARLKHQEFAAWVSKELNGYDDINSVPAYRRLRTFSRGNFVGPMGAAIRDAGIPQGCLPEGVRTIAGGQVFSASVSTLAATIVGQEKDSLCIAWPPDVVAYVQHKTPIFEGYALAEAWRVVPASLTKGVLDIVRTKVLDFALAIEGQNPDAGEAAVNEPAPIPHEEVTNIFNVTIQGGGQAILGSQGNASLSVGSITLSPAIPVEQREEVQKLLDQLRLQADAVEDTSDKQEAKAALAGVGAQLAKPTPNVQRLHGYLELYATIVTAAAPTVNALRITAAEIRIPPPTQVRSDPGGPGSGNPGTLVAPSRWTDATRGGSGPVDATPVDVDPRRGRQGAMTTEWPKHRAASCL